MQFPFNLTHSDASLIIKRLLTHFSFLISPGGQLTLIIRTPEPSFP